MLSFVEPFGYPPLLTLAASFAYGAFSSIMDRIGMIEEIESEFDFPVRSFA
jgi:hypothetical protein